MFKMINVLFFCKYRPTGAGQQKTGKVVQCSEIIPQVNESRKAQPFTSKNEVRSGEVL